MVCKKLLISNNLCQSSSADIDIALLQAGIKYGLFYYAFHLNTTLHELGINCEQEKK